MKKQYSLDISGQTGKYLKVNSLENGFEFVNISNLDIHTTGATLSGTTAVFSINDGNNYNLELSGLSTTTLPFSSITDTPTTISGYGISDTYTQTEIDTKILWEKGVGNLSVKTKGTACAANNNYSVATGFITTANGVSSNAQNQSTVASGNYSNAAGLNTVASGTYAFSEGFETVANGVATHAAGQGTIAHDYAEFVIGKYNIPGTSTGTTDSLFTVGNGINVYNKSNAFQIKSDGTIIITQPTSATTDSYLTINSSGIITKKSFDVNYNQLKLKNTYTVSETGGDFTTIANAVYFVNNLAGTYGITIKLDSGIHYITDTISVNSTHPITIIGDGVNCCFVVEYDELGINLFELYTECSFNGINFKGYAKTSNCITTVNNLSHEILNCNFDNFIIAVKITKSDVFIHNFVITNCIVGIETLGAKYFNKIDCEVGDFTNCEIGIHLFRGKLSIFNIHSCFFSPTTAENIGIVYDPVNYTYRDHPSIQGCKWDNTGIFMSGFDFSRHDGRDRNIVITNNVGLESKNPHAWLNMINNTVSTTLSNNVWTKLNFTGTTFYENNIIFSGNRATYLPSNQRDLKMIGSGALTTSTQISNIELAIIKNSNTGTIVSPISVTLDSNSKKFQWSANAYLQSVGENDFFEIWGRGIGASETIILEDFNWLLDSN